MKPSESAAPLILPALLSWLLFTLCPYSASADQLRVATASNFIRSMTELGALFEQENGHQIIVISGSSGKHFAQIVNGAPYDALFAADTERPARLERERYALAGSRFTYAIGQLVLWSPREDLVDAQGDVLHSGGFRRLAIANPDLAPYGQAAVQVMEALGLEERLTDRLVRGENIAQAFQFVYSGNAELGFVARSQLRGAGMGGSAWIVPQVHFRPIEQQAVLLTDTRAGREFMVFMRGEQARRLIREHGYGTP